MSYPFFRDILFKFDAENIHHATMEGAGLALKIKPLRDLLQKKFLVDDKCLAQTIDGLKYRNPVGLAAGFDKNAQYLDVLPLFGFGAIEIGTVTGECQPGNARPRLFRLQKDQAILNRMGFNNHGCEMVAKRLQNLGEQTGFCLGINIGKTKVVPIDDAEQDYLKSFEALFEFADYVVVNVSSPNTPNLRELQEKGKLSKLLGSIQQKNMELARELRMAAKPIYVKVAPDLTEEALLDVIDVIEEVRGQGIIATNTTISRDNLKTENSKELGAGGISGRPLTKKSRDIIKFLYRNAPNLTIIGVGGIFNSEDALNAIRAGASLVQVWTGFIYQGPTIVKEINDGLIRACRRNKWSNISEAIGIDAEKD